MSDGRGSGWFRDTPESRRLLEIERAKVEAMEARRGSDAAARVELLAQFTPGARILLACDQDDLRAVLAENEAMKLVLWRRIDDEPCDIDHNGYCQAHGVSSPPCWQAEARRLVGQWQPADAAGDDPRTEMQMEELSDGG